jgi:hypothetical protein
LCDKQLFWKCLVSGGLAGTVNGCFGAGGGMILLPLLIHWVKLPEDKAMPNGVAVLAPLSLLSAAVYWLRCGAPSVSVWPFLIGGAAGGLIAGFTFIKMNTLWLRRGFALLVLYGGVRALLS